MSTYMYNFCTISSTPSTPPDLSSNSLNRRMHMYVHAHLTVEVLALSILQAKFTILQRHFHHHQMMMTHPNGFLVQ